MSWFYQNFDSNWVTCANHKCRTPFIKRNILKNRKCPKCKMDNRHQINVPNVELSGGASQPSART